MSDELIAPVEPTTPTQPSAEPAVPPVTTPAPIKTAEEIAEEELAELNREIEEANKSLVSEDVAKIIKLEKEAAKKEAEKEFLVSQRVKELEAEKDALAKAKEQAEKESAAKLEALTQKVNGLISSRAPVANDNPFNAQPPVNTPITTATEFTDEESKDIEKASMEAFFEAKSRR